MKTEIEKLLWPLVRELARVLLDYMLRRFGLCDECAARIRELKKGLDQ